MKKKVYTSLFVAIVIGLFCWWNGCFTNPETKLLPAEGIKPQVTEQPPVIFEYKPLEEDVSTEKELASAQVSGKVLDTEGHPIVGAKIQVALTGTKGNTGLIPRELVAEMYSNAQGDYSFNALPTGAILSFIISHADWAIGGGQIVALSKNESREGINFILHPAVEITGDVVSEQGAPVERAIVFLCQLSESDVYETKRNKDSNHNTKQQVFDFGNLEHLGYILKTETDASGKFRFTKLPEGFILGDLGAEKEGYAIGWAVSHEGQKRREETGNGWWGARRITLPAKDLRIVLKEGGAVAGRVLLANTQAPLSNVSVHFEGLIELMGPFSEALAKYERTVKTNPQGYFSFSDVPYGDFVVHAKKVGQRSQSEHISVARGYMTENILLKVNGEGAIEGRVYDVDTRMPIPDLLLHYNQRGIGSSFLLSRTDEQGYFHIDELAAGAVHVGARTSAPYKLAKSYHPQADDSSIFVFLNVPVQPGMVTRGVDLYCEPHKRYACTVQGTVFDASGNPAPNATVTVLGRGVRRATDEKGEYTLSIAAAGHFSLLVTDQKELMYGETPVMVELGKETQADIHLKYPASRIIGSVINQDRTPAQTSVQVIAVEGGYMPKEIQTGRDGSFEATVLPGFYAISPAAVNSSVKPEPAQYDIRVGDGEEIVGLDFILEPMDGFIAGTVLFANGEPGVSLTVMVVGDGVGTRAITDSSGSFFLHPVTGEELTVQIRIPQNDGLIWASVSPVSTGQDDIEVILDNLGKITAEIIFSGQQTTTVHISETYPAIRYITSLELTSGKMSVSLPPGEYSLSFSTSSNEIVVDALVESDKTTNLGEIGGM
jgi:protocatechuate 3,4-dioxygenase beta subunit